MKILKIDAQELALKLGGAAIAKVCSHNAADNLRRGGILKELKSITWSLYASHHAAEGFYLLDQKAAELSRSGGRWNASVKFPKTVPFDLSAGSFF